MKYVSLFAGIGGFDLALNRLGHECVYVNEWDKYAAQTYEKNFSDKLNTRTQDNNVGNEPNLTSGNGKGRGTYTYDYASRGVDTRSITEVRTNELPEFDLLVGGFPCQAFSIAGKRRGFDDTRGTLFFDIARILKDKRPRYFILENVKGLLSHDSGKTFQTILRVLTDLGYEYQWQVLNSKNFGVPQNRERVFIVGHIRGEPRPKVFPIGKGNESFIEKSERETQTTHPIRAGYKAGQGGNDFIMQLNNPKHSNDRVYGVEGISPTLNTMQGGRRQPKVKINNPLKGKTEYGWHFEQNVYVKDSLVRTLKSEEGSGNKPKIIQGQSIRRLTPLECLRLQGFPDNWFDVEGLSDTQKYKQAGNAVTVNVVQAVAERLVKSDQ